MVAGEVARPSALPSRDPRDGARVWGGCAAAGVAGVSRGCCVNGEVGEDAVVPGADEDGDGGGGDGGGSDANWRAGSEDGEEDGGGGCGGDDLFVAVFFGR